MVALVGFDVDGDDDGGGVEGVGGWEGRVDGRAVQRVVAGGLGGLEFGPGEGGVLEGVGDWVLSDARSRRSLSLNGQNRILTVLKLGMKTKIALGSLELLAHILVLQNTLLLLFGLVSHAFSFVELRSIVHHLLECLESAQVRRRSMAFTRSCECITRCVRRHVVEFSFRRATS